MGEKQRWKFYIVLQYIAIKYNYYIYLVGAKYNIFIEIRQILSELYNILRKKIIAK